MAGILINYIYQNKINLTAYIICGLFLIINLLTLSDYGVSWDEPAQQDISDAAISYIKTGDINNIKFIDSDLKFYGPSFEILNYFSAKTASMFFNLNHIDSHHILFIIFSFVGIVFLYFFVRKLFDEKTAIFSLLFIVLFPRFIGDIHYNPKDIPLMIFSIIVLFFLFLVFNKEKKYHAISAGIFFGLALSLRVDSLLLLPIFFGSYIAYLFFDNIKLKKMFSASKIATFGLFSFSSLVTLFLTWPSLWKDPTLFFHSVLYFLNHGWAGDVLYFGKIYTGSNLPWHYVPLYLLIVTPVALLLFMLFGLFISFRKIKNKAPNSFGLILVIFWLVVPLLIQMMPGAVRYDGIRHSFIIIPALIILAGLGLNHLIVNLKTWFPKAFKFLVPLLVLIVVTVPLCQIIDAHPYEGYYFNEPLRYFIPQNIERYFDIEYWGVSYREGVAWLNKNAVESANICVPIAEHLIREYKIRDDMTFDCAKQYNYLMFPSRTSALPEFIKEVESNNRPVFQVRRFNSLILNIYQIQ